TRACNDRQTTIAKRCFPVCSDLKLVHEKCCYLIRSRPVAWASCPWITGVDARATLCVLI
ncbi:MAG: hypothetical protein ACRD63_17860, partial [Pyrinomonadaceae bacterium]